MNRTSYYVDGRDTRYSGVGDALEAAGGAPEKLTRFRWQGGSPLPQERGITIDPQGRVRWQSVS